MAKITLIFGNKKENRENLKENNHKRLSSYFMVVFIVFTTLISASPHFVKIFLNFLCPENRAK